MDNWLLSQSKTGNLSSPYLVTCRWSRVCWFTQFDCKWIRGNRNQTTTSCVYNRLSQPPETKSIAGKNTKSNDWGLSSIPANIAGVFAEEEEVEEIDGKRG